MSGPEPLRFLSEPHWGAELGDVHFAAIHDPDGNPVELTQLGPSWLEHLRKNRAQGSDLIAAWSARTGS